MLFKETGRADKPVIVLLHGGGLSYWSFLRVAERLAGDYRVVTPVIDGHGDDSGEPFVSIEDSAGKLLEYIDRRHGGRVYAIGGLSLGAQIAAEALSQRGGVASYAILESALVIPSPMLAAMSGPVYKMCYGLIKKRWFAKWQARSMFIPDDLFERYFADSQKMTCQSLINMAVSNARYELKDGIERTNAKTLVIVGEKEIGLMRKSAEALHRRIPGSELYVASSMSHGELSLARPEEYVEIVKRLFG